MRDSDTMRPEETPLTPMPDTGDPDAPATAEDRTGEMPDETYSNEQAQRQKDAEVGRQAEWVATDPVD